MGDSSVVFEDPLMAEYLKSNENNQAMAKPSPLQFGTPPPPEDMISIPKQVSESLYRFWRQSLFHDTFSVSLPIMEEMAFEEKFKYLIVTSHLLNDTLSTHPKRKTPSPPQVTSPFHSAHSRSATMGTVTTLSGLLVALGFERYYIQQNDQQQQQPFENEITTPWKSITPSLTMMLASGVSLFFVYRHMRRSSIRKLYQCALIRLQDVLEQSQLLDNKVHRSFVTIQEIEFTTTTTITTRYAKQLRSQLARILRRAFIIYEEAIIDLSDWINKSTLTRLFDMYNIQSVASLSSATTTTTDDDDEDDGITLDYLKTLAHLMHLKRRECMLQFLALSVMTSDHDSIRKGYEIGWKTINSVLLLVKKETTQFVKDVKEALDNEFGILDRNETLMTTTGMETQPFIHQLELLDQHLRTTEARLYLCNNEILGRQDQQTLKKEYMAMEKDIQHLVTEWQLGKKALDELFTPLVLDTPPSPLPSPTITPTTTHGPSFSFIVTTLDDQQQQQQQHELWPSSKSLE